MMFCGVEEISEPVANGQSPDIVSSCPAHALPPFIGKRNTLAPCENRDFCHPLSSASGFGCFFIRYPGFRHCVAPPCANSCRPPGSNIVCEHQLADFVHTQCGFRPAKRDFVRAKAGYRFQLSRACPSTIHWEMKHSGSMREPRFLPPTQLRFGVRVFFYSLPRVSPLRGSTLG